MKYFSKELLERYRPVDDALYLVDFCLEHLYEDNKRLCHEVVAGNCTYEELIGALLKARDELQGWEACSNTCGSGNWLTHKTLG